MILMNLRNEERKKVGGLWKGRYISTFWWSGWTPATVKLGWRVQVNLDAGRANIVSTLSKHQHENKKTVSQQSSPTFAKITRLMVSQWSLDHSMLDNRDCLHTCRQSIVQSL